MLGVKRSSLEHRVIDASLLAASLLCFSQVVNLAAEGESSFSDYDALNWLFNSATTNRDPIRIEAEVWLSDPVWTKSQVDAELDRQNSFSKQVDRKLSKGKLNDLVLARSNSIVQSHTGTKHLLVQEWYSGNHYRLDQSEVAKQTNSFTSEHSYQKSFVNNLDESFSPYWAFEVDHVRLDALLSKDPARRYQPFELRRLFGVEEPASLPVVLALLDLNGMTASQARNLEGNRAAPVLRVDSAKIQALLNATHPSWGLDIDRGGLSGAVTYSLRGKYADPDSPIPLSDVVASYSLSYSNGHVECNRIVVTNLTLATSYESKREDFDSAGYPRNWLRTTRKTGLVISETRVVVRSVDLSPSFAQSDVFLPQFSSNYTVSDITSGSGVVLQRPARSFVAQAPDKTGLKLSRRLFVLAAMILVVFLPVLILFTRRKIAPFNE